MRTKHNDLFIDLEPTADGGEGAGGGEGEPSGEAPPEVEGSGGSAERTFSQAELDRVVKERLARQKAQFGDYDDLKTKATEYDKLAEAQKTELQKAQDRAAELEQKMTAAEQRAQETALKAAVISEAAKKNVIDPDVAVALIDKGALEFGEDGSPMNVAELVDALLEQRPYLVAASGGSRGNADLGARSGGTGPQQVTREALARMSPQEVVKARQEGRLSDLLSGS